MPNVPSVSVQNNFIGGLKTEATALNFPENACTDTQNCVFTLIGDVLRREGIDFEKNSVTNIINRTGKAISTYKWNNVGGDGETQIVVTQVGNTLYFYQSTEATVAQPLSTTLIPSQIDLTPFLASGSSKDPSIVECQFADGNGYLFVFHPNCDPFYCTFVSGTPSTVTATIINLQIRDFSGIFPEPGNPVVTFRPTSLTHEHFYNLQNQGWTDSAGWTTSCFHDDSSFVTISGTTATMNTGSITYTNVGSGISGITVNDPVSISSGGSVTWTNGGVIYTGGTGFTGNGVVTAYSGTSLTITVTSGSTFSVGAGSIISISGMTWNFSKNSSITNTIGVWNSALANYPSNADIWYLFKDSTGVFNPAVTIGTIALPTSPATGGHFVTSAFNQNKSAISGVPGLTSIVTDIRPRTGCWNSGRIWYTGVDSSQGAVGDEPYYTWTENIYFSQVITDINQAGNCFQTNDPTDQNFFDLLDTDGGVITIQGCGAIYKLFPIQNGVLVFAANGIWFITGRQGIGFAANDYTITKISGVQNISSTSHINSNGYPIFWNEEGIYSVSPGETGSLTVNNICLGTILTFYQDIPLQSKKFARGDYDPINFEIQWCYRSTNESSLTDRYQFDRILILNVVTKAFYYYTLSAGLPYLHDVRYVAGPGGSTSPDPTMKYLSSYASGSTYLFSFAEELDNVNYLDWFSVDGVGVDYNSYFITGYLLRGQPKLNKPGELQFGTTKWQPTYIYLFCRNDAPNSYGIQGLWEFATSGNSGKWSTKQIRNDNTNPSNFGMVYHRYKIRGHGLSMQIKVTSVKGKPFDIMGWSIFETQSASV